MNINIDSRFCATLILLSLAVPATSLVPSAALAADPQKASDPQNASDPRNASDSHIAEISTDEVRSLLEQQRAAAAEAERAGRPAPQAEIVLVDVRSEAEVNVSVIPGAITKEEFEKHRDKYAGRTVVPYCAVGGRSARYASKLAEDGLPVKNYKGSILAWVSAELPLVTLQGKPTDRVFAFSESHHIPAKYKQVRK